MVEVDVDIDWGALNLNILFFYISSILIQCIMKTKVKEIIVAVLFRFTIVRIQRMAQISDMNREEDSSNKIR